MVGAWGGSGFGFGFGFGFWFEFGFEFLVFLFFGGVLKVDGTKDATFRRHTRSEISVFQMNQKLTELVETLDDLRGDLKDDADAHTELVGQITANAVSQKSSLLHVDW